MHQALQPEEVSGQSDKERTPFVKHKKINRWPTREEREAFAKELASIARMAPENPKPGKVADYLNEVALLLMRFTSLEDSPVESMKKLKELGERGRGIFCKEEEKHGSS
mgnify:CR=1 FL=1